MFMQEENYMWSHTAYKMFGNNQDEIIEIDNYSGKIYPKILLSSP